MGTAFRFAAAVICFVSLGGVPAALRAQTGPAGVNSGIRLWLDASNVNNTNPASSPPNNTRVAVWRDVSGNNNNAIIYSNPDTAVMDYGSVGGKNSLRFTRFSDTRGCVYQVAGVDIRATSMVQTTNFTVYVQGPRTSSELHGLWGDDNGNWDRFFMPSAGLHFGNPNTGLVSIGLGSQQFVAVPNSGQEGVTKVLASVYDYGVTGGSTIYFNGLPVQTVTDLTDPNDARHELYVGWDGDNNPFNGRIAEMIVYNRKLTTCEIIAVNRYLSQKYGITITTASITSPYSNICPGGSATLTSSSGTGYQWLRNNSTIPSATGQTYNASIAGSYRVIVSSGSCVDTSAPFVLGQVDYQYVDSSVSTSGDGSSWVLAKKTVQEALDVANATSCGIPIYVAKGTYYPMNGTAMATAADASMSILHNGIKLYGGFPSGGAAFTARNITANPTILSGNINSPTDSNDNSYHVLVIAGRASSPIDTNTVVDGFTIRDGNSRGYIGTTNIGSIILTIDGGGGIYCTGAGAGSTISPLLVNNTFTRNTSGYGAGLYLNADSSSVSSPVVRNCSFLLNTAYANGGGIYGATSNGATLSLPVTGSTFTANKTVNGGGGGIGIAGGALSLSNCTFTGNSSLGPGNGQGAGVLAQTGSSVTANNCIFNANTAYDGGGFNGRTAGAVLFTNSRFINNTAVDFGGAITQVLGPLSLRNIVFSGNSTKYGGAIHCNINGSDTVFNCVFTGNSGSIVGGAIHQAANSRRLRVVNSTFSGNTSGNGGAIYAESNVENADITNSILWGNTATSNPGIAKAGSAALTVTYSTVQGGYTGTGNTSSNPQFTNPANPIGPDNTWGTADDGLELTIISSALNTGLNSATTSAGLSTDFAGAARIQQTTVDMGAYEGYRPLFCLGSARLYVDSSKAGSGDGTSWAEAYKTVWEALTVADSCTGVSEIWVAKGTYYPMAGATIKSTVRDSSLRISRNGLKLYGGFPAGGSVFASRNVTGNPTILSGDLGALNDSTDNAYHVMTVVRRAGSSIDTSTRVDGFTITGGFANLSANSPINGVTMYSADAGGMYIGGTGTANGTSPYIANCTFLRNAAVFGGAVYSGQSASSGTASPWFENCSFVQNTGSNQGGGMVQNSTNNTSQPRMINCSFVANAAGSGGGVYNGGSAVINYRGCTFNSNTASSTGGAIFNSGLSSMTADSCRFFSNHGGAHGGAIDNIGSTLTITGAVFYNNDALNSSNNGAGGALATNGSTVSVGNSLFVDNKALGTSGDYGGGAIISYGGATTVTNSTFNNNTTLSTLLPNANSLAAYAGTITLNNSIVWGSAAQQTGSQSGTLQINYSLVKGITATAPNLAVDPLFVSAATPLGADNIWATSDDGLRLTACSRAIDAGSNALATAAGLVSDITGPVSPRIQQNAVDMGAYESALASTPIPITPTSISGPTQVCAGIPVSYSVTPVPGATSYTWNLPAGWSGATSSNAITVTPSASAVSGSISVTASGPCGSSPTPASLAVAVVATPATPGPISGASNTCAGVSQTYSVSAVAGVSYQWTLPPGWTITSTPTTAASITVTPSATGGTISVAALNACGASSPTATLTTTGGGAPAAPGAISGPAALCVGLAQTYSVAAVAGASSYQWTLPSGWTGTSTTNTISVTATSATSGTLSVKALNACATAAAAPSSPLLSVSAATTPAAPGTVSGATAVCAGVAQTYSVSAVTGVTYNWSLPSGWTGTSSTASISATPSTAGGSVSVTASNYCGTSAASPALAVSSSQIPAAPGAISGVTAACSGIAQTYTVGAVAGATSYAWTLTGSLSGNGSTTNTVVVTPGLGAGGTLAVTAANYCGTSPASPVLAVSATTTPAVPAVPSGATAVCAPSTTNTYTVSAVNGATSYTWTLPPGWTAVSLTTTGPSITAAAPASAASGTITVSASNYCGSSAASAPLAVTVTAAPAQPGTVSGPVAVCAGTSASYSIAAITGAASYQWTVPVGWTITTVPPTGATIAVTAAGPGAGTITVRAVNSCGLSAVQSLSVTTNTVPGQPGLISGAVTVCGGTTNAYSVAPVAAASSYAWTLPVGWTGASSTTSIASVAGTAGGTVQVAGVNQCGAGAARSLAVTVNNVPAQPGPVSGLAGLCYGASQTYSVAAVATASSYAWTLPPGWLASGPVTGTSVTLSAGSAGGGVLSVVALNGCGASAAQTLAVSNEAYALVAVSPGGPVALCVGDTVSLHAVSGGAGGGVQTGWQWYYNGVAMAGANDSVWRVYAQGTYQVVATTANGCRDTAEATASAVVRVPVIVNVVASPGVNIGAGQPVTFTATVTNGGSNPVWRWYRNGSLITGVTGNVYTSATLADGDAVWAWVRSDKGCTVSDTVSSNVLKIRITTGVAGVGGDRGRGLRLYPNPAGGDFTVERVQSSGSGSGVVGGGGQVELLLSDGLGQVVERVIGARGAGGEWKVRVRVGERLANGLYWVRVVERDGSGEVVSGGEGRVSLPVVVQR